MVESIQNKLKIIYKNIKIEKENELKIILETIKKIDSFLLEINNQLLKIQPEIYGRVEINFGTSEIYFKIWQRLSKEKFDAKTGYKLRHFTLCKKYILARIKNKPNYINNKEQIKPLITNAEYLIKLRYQLIENQHIKKSITLFNRFAKEKVVL